MITVISNQHGISDDELLALACAIKPDATTALNDYVPIYAPSGRTLLFDDGNVRYWREGGEVIIELYSKLELAWSRLTYADELFLI